jgi:SNF2 family DNA or RNA helicase
MQWFHDPQRKLLIYERSAAIEQRIPETRALNGKYVAVPATLQNAQTLRWLQYPVPMVMTDQNYDFPIEPGKTALPHQKIVSNFQLLHPKSFNLGDPGTMKTQSALWAADWLARRYPPGKCRALVVAPLTILDTVWANAIFKSFLGKRTFEILHGTPDKRMALLAKKPDFAIINFDGVGVGAHTRKRFELDGFCKALYDDDDIKIIIADEADAYCDSQTRRHRIARLVFGKRPYIWALSGTPTSTAPTDAYGIAKLINNAWGKSFTTFRDETMMKVSQFAWRPRADGYEKARKLLSPSVRFSIEEVWQNAPEMTTQVRKVELTAEQNKMLAALKRDLQVELKTGKLVQAINEAAARTKFLQIVLGAIYDSDHKAHTVDATPRMDEIDRLVTRSPHKVLIFAGFTSVIHILNKHLSKKWKCGVIIGDTTQKDRTQLIHQFESDPNFKVMIMDPQPTAHGINEFVVADTVIWAGPTEKTRLYIQACRRAHRPGQKFPVSVYQVVATRLEQEIFRRLETNTNLQGAMLAAIQKGEF